MAYFNKDEVYQVLDGTDVADRLGIEVTVSRERSTILCTNPEHDDSHKGNCILNQRGHYCFVCNRQTNLEGMVMNVLGMNYKEALHTLAGWAGICPEKQNSQKKQPPLSDNELQELNLTIASCTAKALDVKTCTTVRKSPLDVRDKDGNFLQGRKFCFSLRKLWEEDPECYRIIVDGKIQERLEIITESVLLYSTREGREFLKEAGTTYTALQNVLYKEKKRLITAREKLYAS